VVAIDGVVRSRPNESINKKMITGSIEVYIINKCNFTLVLDQQEFVSGRFCFIYQSPLFINLFIFSSTCYFVNKCLYSSDWFLDSKDLFFFFLERSIYLYQPVFFFNMRIRLLQVAFKC